MSFSKGRTGRAPHAGDRVDHPRPPRVEDSAPGTPLAAVANPFVAHVVRTAWDEAEQDVPEINARALALCLRGFDLVGAQGRAASVVLFGEPGTGKTHLLNRLRRRAEREGQWFVYVQPVAGPERMFRNILGALAHDLLNPIAGPGSLSQLEVILAHRLAARMAGAGASMPQSSGCAGPAPAASADRDSDPLTWWREVRQLYGRPEQMIDLLSEPLEAMADELGLGSDLARVLVQYVARRHRLDARDWLAGRGVAEAALDRLGVGDSLDDEDRARDAIVQLFHLAGPDHRAILAFDQLENLEGAGGEVANLKAWGRAVASLFDRCPNVLIVCCAQLQFHLTLQRALPLQDFQRICQLEGSLETVTRDQAARLVAARLDCDPALGALRRQHPDEPLWPITGPELDRCFASSNHSARAVLAYCREVFDARQRGDRPPDAPRPPDRAADWPGLWARTIEAGRDREDAAAVLDEGELINGLRDLLDVAPRPGLRPEPAAEGLRDVGLVLVSEPPAPGGRSSGSAGRAPGWRIGVSVCQTEEMKSLAARLRRLLEHRDEGRIDALVVVRDARLRTGGPGSQTAKRFERLAAEGMPVVRIAPETSAALRALRALLRGATAGDLSIRGHTLGAATLRDWIRAALPSELAAASDAVFGSIAGPAVAEPDPEADALADRLIGLLRTYYVESMPAAAQGLDVEEDCLLRAARRRPEQIGYLEGPPETLFLRPEAPGSGA